MQRPKKPNVSLIQEKKFSRMIEGLRHRPHNGIINRIDSKIFSLDGNDLFRYKTEVLAQEEYKRCLELFERRLPQEFNLPTQEAFVRLQMQLQMMTNVIFNKEMIHIETLKEIAVDTIRSLFDIPGHINILSEIEMDLDINEQEQDDSLPEIEISPERMRYIMEEIRKREILNSLANGCAMHIWKSAHFLIKDKIDKIDPMLMEFYNIYTSAVGWLIWQMNPDSFMDAIQNGNSITQGFCKLEFEEKDNPNCNIHCHGINFPVLLHEITKGAIDYLISRGIPKDLNNEELKFYYAKADCYSNELWHYLLSPTIWVKLVEAADVDTQNLPHVIMKLTELKYQELAEILKICIDDKQKGNEKLKEKKII